MSAETVTGGQASPEEKPAGQAVKDKALPETSSEGGPGLEGAAVSEKRYTKRYKSARLSFYVIATIIGAAVIVIFSIQALGSVADALNTAFISLFTVFLLRRPVAYMERHGINRSLGSLIAIVALLALTALIGAIVWPMLSSQLQAFVKAVPGFIKQFVSWADGLADQFNSLASNGTTATLFQQIGTSFMDWFSGFSSGLASNIVNTGISVGRIAIVLLMALVATFWFLRDLPKMKEEVGILVPRKHARDFHAVVAICAQVVDGYIVGMLISAAVTGIIAFIGFTIIGLPYAGILAFLTGILKIIPIVGPWIAGAAAGIVGLFTSPLECVLAIAISVIAQQVCDIFIMPRIMSSTIDLHPALVVIALMIGAGVGGILGMVLAVPVIAAAKNIFAYYFEQRTGRVLATPDGALFKSVERKKRKGRGTSDGASGADADA